MPPRNRWRSRFSRMRHYLGVQAMCRVRPVQVNRSFWERSFLAAPHFIQVETYNPISMATLHIKPAASCKYDLIALGEIMLRLDPGEGRVRAAREFKVWEGGGEYNVARGLRRVCGLKTAVCTAFADNDVGRLIEDFILQGGVDIEFVKWVPYDGVGRSEERRVGK